MPQRIALLIVPLAAALRPRPSTPPPRTARLTPTLTTRSPLRPRPSTSPPRSPLSPLVDVLPPKVRAEGPTGLAGYSAVELCWWGAPAAFTYLAVDGSVADTAAVLEAAKAPFLAALLFWPNSWFRNGVAIRIARVLQRRPMP